MRLTVPPVARTLFFISVPLFLVHVIEEYVTLYYPTRFGIIPIPIDNLPPEKFIRTELIVIAVLLTFAYLLYIRRLPSVLLILPGLLYLWQFEHIYHAMKTWSCYYPGLFIGVMLFILGIFFWGSLLTGISFKKKEEKMNYFFRSSSTYTWL